MIEYLKGIKSLTQISHELRIDRGRLSTYIKKHGYNVINK